MTSDTRLPGDALRSRWHGRNFLEISRRRETRWRFSSTTDRPGARQKASARFFAKIFGLEYKGLWGHFAPVKVNETLSLDFDNRDVASTPLRVHRFGRGVRHDLRPGEGRRASYGSGPMQDDMQINHLHTGRGFYFNDRTATA